MCAAVKEPKGSPSGLRRRMRVSRTDLLSHAHPAEINWENVAPFLKDRQPGTAPFVYFIIEGEDGPVKIGQAKNPIQRLRSLQTGNARPLKIEFVIYGDLEFERLLHEYWRPFAIVGSKLKRADRDSDYFRETEWFAPEARKRILDAADEISFRQLAAPHGTTTLDDMYLIVGEVMTELGYEIRRPDELRYLGKHGGYVVKKNRPA